MSEITTQIENLILSEELLQLENERKSYIKKMLFSVVVTCGIAAACIIASLKNVTDSWGLILGIAVFLIGVLVIWILHRQFVKKFKVKFKEQVIPEVVKLVREDLQYDPTRSLMDEYYESNLYPTSVDRFKAEDTISGKEGETDFLFGEVFTEYKSVNTDGDGNRRDDWVTIFKGILFVSDFHKNFQGETYVDIDIMERFLGKLGRGIQKMKSGRPGKLVKLENPAFEKYFAIYSTDEQECRYILSPSMMERILLLRDKLEGMISISFKNNQMYIGVHNNKDLFEPRIFTSITRKSDYEYLTTLLTMLVGIVHDLNLNTRIWTKE